jgi:HK97 gp10 family phage protein
MAALVRFQLDGTGVAEVERRTDSLVERLADLSAADMERTAPVDSGDMVSTIRVEKPRDLVRHVKCGGMVGASGEYVDYAVYVELGTSRMAAQPFMRPALYRLRTAAEGLGF